MHQPELMVVADLAALFTAAADEFSKCAQAAIAAHGRFCVALSGGNTPRGVYSLLAEKYKKALPWDRIFLFFGDERHVPPDDPDSNYRMANESLLSKILIPPANIFRVHAELPADVAADQYGEQLRRFFQLQANEWPRFDLVFLGIGEDGHTASLFPGSAAIHETSRLAVANWVEKFQHFRITLTYPVLNHSAQVVFLVSGDSKSTILRDVLRPAPGKNYPAQAVQPQDGRLLWILDQDAAQLL